MHSDIISVGSVATLLFLISDIPIFSGFSSKILNLIIFQINLPNKQFQINLQSINQVDGGNFSWN